MAVTGPRLRLLAMLVVVFCLSNAASRAAWTLVWSDEFNGNSLNTNSWWTDLGPGVCISGNGELEVYTNSPQNVFVTNGMLHIVAQNIGSGTNYYFTSARLITWNIDDCSGTIITNMTPSGFQYGAIEFRAKLPAGLGFWPALWMLPAEQYTAGENPIYGGWPGSGEIDVMENDGSNTNEICSNLYYQGGNDQACAQVADVTQWHVYRVEWTTNQFQYLVDGVAYHTVTNWNSPTGYAYPVPFNTAFYIIMNLALGGVYTGNPTPAEVAPSLPGEMDIDYVRVYQQTAPSTISAAMTNGNVMLSWPTNVPSHLQSQRFLPAQGSNSSWMNLYNTTNPFVVPVSTNSSTFYRLVSP